MMYTVTRMMEDFEMVKAMLKVIDKVENKERFTCADIDEEVRHHYRLDPHGYYRNEPRNFGGSALKALVRRGILEVIGEEDYVYTEEGYRGKIHKRVGTRKIYRYTGVDFETYKREFANLMYLKIMTA